ncbi:serine hydrolase [Solimonas flava]|uniref:serine hydrolase n=1 Tax=Solimonas flava TaxID=415849 RepID=UPI0003F6F874|nr:serine hydrolase [Solimonas flava]
MKKILLAGLALTLVATGGLLFWQWRMTRTLAAELDFNRNGRLEPEEAGPLLRRHFAQFDRDGDGSLDDAELLRFSASALLGNLRIRMHARGLPDPALPARASVEDLRAALQQMTTALELDGAALIVGRDGAEQARVQVGAIGFDSVVPVASSSKWVSAVVLMRLVEQRRLDLDRPLSAYLPELGGPWARTTPRQLFSHTAGADLGHALNYSPEMPADELFARLVALPMHDAPGTAFTYGGIAMQIGGHLAERVSGRRWTTLFVDEVATPAGMASSFYAHPIWYREGADLPSANVAAGLHTSAQDYARFLVALQRPGMLLSQASIDTIETDYSSALVQNFRPPGIDPTWSYGLGLWCEQQDGRRCTRVSSAGALGTYPWLDRSSGRYGVLVTLGSVKTVMPFARHLRALAERLDAGPAPAPTAAPP